MSRPDRARRVAVDFAPPAARSGVGRKPAVAVLVVIVMLVGVFLGVTQLLLR